MNRIKLILSFTIIAFVFIFISYITYNTAEAKAYDYMLKHFTIQKLPFDTHKQVHGSDDIVLVMIDSKTVEKYRWPWKRETNCKLFEYLNNYTDSKVIVHDSILATLDRDYPQSDKKFFHTLSKFDNLVEGFMPVIKNWDNPEKGKAYDSKFALFPCFRVLLTEIWQIGPWMKYTETMNIFLNTKINIIPRLQ